MRKVYKQKLALIEYMYQDCLQHGYGRKKWWAEKLNVSPMMISHWIAGRRNPNASHFNEIYIAIEEIIASQQKVVWSDFLWKRYYENNKISDSLLFNIVENLLKSEGLPTRLLALLSWFFENNTIKPCLQPPVVSLWKNRLGWLYESAKRKPGFSSSKLKKTGTLLEISTPDMLEEKYFKEYLLSKQTNLGHKWQLYDCSLDTIKEQLNWRHQLNIKKSLAS